MAAVDAGPLAGHSGNKEQQTASCRETSEGVVFEDVAFEGEACWGTAPEKGEGHALEECPDSLQTGHPGHSRPAQGLRCSKS